MPLLLLNGWPSSPVEYRQVIDLSPILSKYGGAPRRLPRRGAVDAGIRLFGQAAGARLQPGAHGAGGRRSWRASATRRYIVHGSDWGISVATYLALADSSHISGLHLAGCPGGAHRRAPPPPAATAPRSRRLVIEPRLSGDPDDEAADAWPGLERFAARAGVVDHRQVAFVERPRRRPREGLHEGRAPHEHHVLLGHQLPAPRRRGCITSRVM